jgi:peptidoglycan hydrolase-like protein with peptidoglycan-binding domain
MFGDTREPLTRNLYIYGNANPLTYVDPSGHYVAEPYPEEETSNNGDNISSVGQYFTPFKFGDRGEKVETIQNRLNNWVLIRDINIGNKQAPQVAEDGIFGINTKNRVNLFKNKYMISNEGSNNGVVDENTWNALEIYKCGNSKTSIANGDGTYLIASKGVSNDTGEVTLSGKKYGIFVPSLDRSGSNAVYQNSGGWITDPTKTKKQYITVTNKAMAAADFLSGGLHSSGKINDTGDGEVLPGNKSANKIAIISVLAAAVDAAYNNSEIFPIQISIQTKGNDSRAIIEIGYGHKAIKSIADRPGNSIIMGWDAKYDSKFTFDSDHKYDPFTAYISKSSGKYMAQLKLYPKDDLEIGHAGSFLNEKRAYWKKTEYHYRQALEQPKQIDESQLSEEIDKFLNSIK